jgi:hypothetical protein
VLTGSTPEVHVPLQLLDDEQWARISCTQIPTSLPVQLYNDRAFPNSNLYLWGVPDQANDLELYTPLQLSNFALSAYCNLPPGYQAAFTYTLAEMMAAQWKVALPPMVVEAARRARSAVIGANSKAPKISTADCGMPHGGVVTPYFNYRTGGF